MAFRPADVIGLIWSHPIVSVAVFLLFTPPLFPIVVYFSPLLISTALFVLAMISMGSDVGETPTYSSDIPSKRGWIEDAAEIDGPYLDGERVPKRLKATSKDESWFDKMKNWEGTGRAWVESVLSQESRRSVSSDENAATREDAVPLLASAREFFTEENRRRSPQVIDESKPVRQTGDEQAPAGPDDSAPSVPVEASDSVDGQSRAVPDDIHNVNSEITPALESEDEITLKDIPPSPLFRNRLVPKSDAAGIVAANGVQTQGASSKDIRGSSQTTEPVSSAPGTDSEEDKKAPSASNSTIERVAPIVEKDHAKLAATESISHAAEIAPAIDDGESKASSVLQKEKPQSTAGETKSETKDESSNVGADRNLAENAQTNGATESSSGTSDTPSAHSPETKSAAELLAPLRHGNTYGLGTPSAAVALSEKLKVPLEDIMSLLAGDDGENVSSGGPAVVKVSSSSETTTSQEEEWSSSDGELSVPVKPAGGPSVEKKDD